MNLTEHQVQHIDQFQREWEYGDRTIRETLKGWARRAAREGIEEGFYFKLVLLLDGDNEYAREEAIVRGLDIWRQVVRERFVMARDLMNDNEEDS